MYLVSSKQISITIITVCLNAENIIDETIQSVINQSYKFIEYIIIDGNSTDRTVSLIQDKMAQYPILFISEPDNGIYDAMNKGIKLAKGDFIQFLNAGDVLADEYVIENVVSELELNRHCIYYGNIIYRYPEGKTKKGATVKFAEKECITTRGIVLIIRPFLLQKKA